MAVIFLLSDQESLDSGLGWLDHVGRKVVHFGEYALLCALWWRALRAVVPGQAAFASAFVIASAYAATDEFHQTFVTGRHGSPWDWAIDAAGVGLAGLLVWRRAYSQPRSVA